MCGRFALKAPPADIASHFGVDAVPEAAPRYNIAPTRLAGCGRQRWRYGWFRPSISVIGCAGEALKP